VEVRERQAWRWEEGEGWARAEIARDRRPWAGGSGRRPSLGSGEGAEDTGEEMEGVPEEGSPGWCVVLLAHVFGSLEVFIHVKSSRASRSYQARFSELKANSCVLSWDKKTNTKCSRRGRAAGASPRTR